MASSEILINEVSEGVAANPSPGPPPSKRRTAFRAASWTVVERFVSQGVRLVGNLILSRLLFPEAFGISAMIAVFQEALVMFTDFGTGDTVVLHEDGDKPEFVNTVWTIQVLRGLALTAVAVGLSWPAAWWWLKNPDIAPMLAVSSLQLAINGFTSIKQALAVREMRLGEITRRNLVSQAIGLGTLIFLAFWLRSAWAMVYGGVIAVAVQTILTSVMLSGPRSRFAWDRQTLVYHSHFGRWTFASTMLTFLAGRGDSFLMARYLTEAMFGIYNISNTLAAMPASIIQLMAARVAFPLLSQVARGDRSRLASAYDRACSLMYFSSLPAIGLLAGTAPMFVHILYDPRYWQASWLTRLLAGRAALDCLFAPGKAALTALGQPRYSAIAQASRAIILVTCLPPAYWYYGVLGAATVAAGNGVLALLVIQWGLYHNDLLDLRREFRGLAFLVAGGAVGFALDSLLGPLIRGICLFISTGPIGFALDYLLSLPGR